MKKNTIKKTIKKISNNISKKNILTEKQKQIICKKFGHESNTFEDKIEELFKLNKINIVSSSFNLEKQIIKDLKKAVSPSDYKPNDDFYSYINERWIKDIDLEVQQEYIIQIDNFRLTQDKVYRELVEIIEDAIKLNSPFSKLLKKAYNSFKIYISNEDLMRESQDYVNMLDELFKDKNNLWKLLALINKNEIINWGSPFVWSINPDDKNPKYYKCYLEPPQPTLLDIDIYFEDENISIEEKNYRIKYKKEYKKYLNILFTLCFGEEHNFIIEDIIDCERIMVDAMTNTLIDESKLDPDGYNVITLNEAEDNFGFNWREFCKEMGFKTIPKDFVSSNINYLLIFTKILIENWSNEKWRSYWTYIYIRQLSRLNSLGNLNFFNFNGSFLRGQQRNIDDTIRPIFFMGLAFNTFLTNEYVMRYKNDQLVQYVKNMAEDLKVVFGRIIQRNKWMSKKTKLISIDKLKSLKFRIGNPENLSEDPVIDYIEDDPWGNLIKISNWRSKKAVNLVGKKTIDIPVIDWSQNPPKFIGTQAYIVNAMYTPTENTIYIPLGYVQKPFVDLEERGIEYNLAHIGFTIAHEMSHSLDDLGSKYDKDGKLGSWWSEHDKKEYYKIQKDIVEQYEKFASYDNITFDAWPSIGEDLADISALSICIEYLRDFQLKNKDILPIQSLSFEAFYIYFALQSRQKISKKAILAQLKTNPHPLDKYRCNVPLSRTRIFSAIYNVQKHNKMYWRNFNSVWSS